MILHRFANGDFVHRDGAFIVAELAAARKVLSTSPANGGYREDLRQIFNYNCMYQRQEPFEIKDDSYASFMTSVAEQAGLDVEHCAGLSTSADMKNAAVVSLHYKDISVTAIVTAGVDVNGGRVGEKADWYETEGNFIKVDGTVNIFLFINADLSKGAMVRSVITTTEAKTAVLQELLVPSCYSCDFATGSGTDGIIVVADPSSPVKLTEAGKHYKLGELIGKSVMEAVRQALYRQTGLCADQQFDIFKRIGRFGLTEQHLWDIAVEQGIAPNEISSRLKLLVEDKKLVIYTSLFAHLLDQLRWRMIPVASAADVAAELLVQLGSEDIKTKTKKVFHNEDELISDLLGIYWQCIIDKMMV